MKYRYQNIKGESVSLDTLCRTEPEWAASRIRSMTKFIESVAKSMPDNSTIATEARRAIGMPDPPRRTFGGGR